MQFFFDEEKLQRSKKIKRKLTRMYADNKNLPDFDLAGFFYAPLRKVRCRRQRGFDLKWKIS